MAHYRSGATSPVPSGSTLTNSSDRPTPLLWGLGCPLSPPTPLPNQPISYWEQLLGDG